MNLDGAIAAVASGDLARVRQLGKPLAVVGDLSRALICAAPGCVLIGGDFSSIESRVLAWLAGEKWKLDAYREFDQSGDLALEPYCVTAARILKRAVRDEADRGIGKTCDLAFGYGGGLGAWRRFDRSTNHGDQAVEAFKNQWRAAHGATVKLWRDLRSSIFRAMRSGRRVELRNLAVEYLRGNLLLTLPSGRRIAYPQARLDANPRGAAEFVFKDNAKGGWSEARAWYGTFTENVVQAIARDLLAAAMLRIEAAGLPVVLHVHDEIVCEVPAADTARFLQLMTTLPAWAAGLPLAVKAWTNTRFVKEAQTAASPLSSASTSPVPSPPPPPPPPILPMPLAATKKVNGQANGTANGHAIASVNGKAITLSTAFGWEQIPLPDLIGQPLVNGKIPCPFHGESVPSLHVYDDHYHCFGCGAHGDQLEWLVKVEGMPKAAAIKLLANWHGRRIAPAADSDADKAQKLKTALSLFAEARPIIGTRAEIYLLRVRGIDTKALPDLAEVLRYHPNCPFDGVYLPCLLALYRDVETNAPAGIHRIALTRAVFAGAKVRRMALGSWPSPRAVKLWPAGERLFVGEGLETVLAAASRLHLHGEFMRPAWAAGSTSSMSKLPPVKGVGELVLLVDNDVNGRGQEAAAQCAGIWNGAGRRVRKLKPKERGTDFNDIFMPKATPP